MLGSWLAASRWTQKGVLSKLSGLYYSVFGVPELHSHIRFWAIKGYLQHSERTVDLGTGAGLMAVAFVKRVRRRCVAVSYLHRDGSNLRSSLRAAGLHSTIESLAADATALPFRKGSVNQILLIDVLEHISDESAALRAILRALKPGGLLVLSVPTENYIDYFGPNFDREIGHVRHYSAAELEQKLSDHGFCVKRWEYHTKGLTAALCCAWYRKLPQLGHWGVAVRLLVLPVFLVLSAIEISVRTQDPRKGHQAAGIVMLAERRGK